MWQKQMIESSSKEIGKKCKVLEQLKYRDNEINSENFPHNYWCIRAVIPSEKQKDYLTSKISFIKYSFTQNSCICTCMMQICMYIYMLTLLNWP